MEKFKKGIRWAGYFFFFILLFNIGLMIHDKLKWEADKKEFQKNREAKEAQDAQLEAEKREQLAKEEAIPLTYEIVDKDGAPLKTLESSGVTILVKAYADAKDVPADEPLYTIIKDKNGVYYKTQINNQTKYIQIEGADPASFKYDIPYNGTFSKIFARDKNNVYFNNQIIKGADPKTFIHISSAFAKDNLRVYYEGQGFENSDPATFVLEQNPTGKVAQDKNLVYINEGEFYPHIVTYKK